MAKVRKRIHVEGNCRHITFRLFVQELAAQLGLSGLFHTDGGGPVIEVEGNDMAVARFIERLGIESPDPADVRAIRAEEVDIEDETAFRVRHDRHAAPIGASPAAIVLDQAFAPVIALGGEMQSVLCFVDGANVRFGPPLGDLTDPGAAKLFAETFETLRGSAGASPRLVAHDMHPDYVSTRFATGIREFPTAGVPHGEAHVAARMADAGHFADVIGVVFDGTGVDEQGRLAGGEFYAGNLEEFRLAARLHPVPQPGGERAVREPWRMAYAWLDHADGEELFERKIRLHARTKGAKNQLLVESFRRGIHSPPTTSVERLLDAAASLLDLRDRSRFEGEAMADLEQLQTDDPEPPYPFSTHVLDDGTFLLDPAEAVSALVDDIENDADRIRMVNRLYETLAQIAAAGAGRIAARTGINKVVLAGRVFQNARLARRVEMLLEDKGLEPLRGARVSAGDDGLCLGQAVIAATRAGKA